MTIAEESVEIDYGNKITISLTSKPREKIQWKVYALYSNQEVGQLFGHILIRNFPPTQWILVKSRDSHWTRSYYPPGTEFDLEIELIDVEGNIYRTRSNNPSNTSIHQKTGRMKKEKDFQFSITAYKLPEWKI
ncbi:MAG: hypothetical protein CM1200mP39_11440 [Dehalococcoidia bacterium]|nr:MAG: hypothetical protein CM1200mP39_11440 [Dehalococcoidia bacterium]